MTRRSDSTVAAARYPLIIKTRRFYITGELRNVDRTQTFQAARLAGRAMRRMNPRPIRAKLNHCASLNPEANEGLIRQNSTINRAKPARIK